MHSKHTSVHSLNTVHMQSLASLPSLCHLQCARGVVISTMHGKYRGGRPGILPHAVMSGESGR